MAILQGVFLNMTLCLDVRHSLYMHIGGGSNLGENRIFGIWHYKPGHLSELISAEIVDKASFKGILNCICAYFDDIYTC